MKVKRPAVLLFAAAVSIGPLVIRPRSALHRLDTAPTFRS